MKSVAKMRDAEVGSSETLWAWDALTALLCGCAAQHHHRRIFPFMMTSPTAYGRVLVQQYTSICANCNSSNDSNKSVLL